MEVLGLIIDGSIHVSNRFVGRRLLCSICDKILDGFCNGGFEIIDNRNSCTLFTDFTDDVFDSIFDFADWWLESFFEFLVLH